MKISLSLEAGFLPAKYSKFAPNEQMLENTPITSPPIKITEIPTETKALALVMLDDDAIPVGGFTWIHWVTLITNPIISELPENISQLNPDYLIQGRNSLAGRLALIDNPLVNQRYTGPQPPDQDHEYEIKLYALDFVPDLPAGFWLNQLYKQIDGHILEHATAKFLGKS